MIRHLLYLIRRFKPYYLSIEVQRLIFPECKTLLDVACGVRSVVRTFNTRLGHSVGVDLYKPALDEAQKNHIHDEYVHMDVLKIDSKFEPQSFDCVLAVDIIEHLPKDSAIELIEKAESLAKKIVILQTTNGYFHQDETDGNKYQEHKSGFSLKDLEELGYTVRGLDGPRWLWRFKLQFTNKIIVYSLDALCLALDPLMRFLPQYSHTLLAYKKMVYNAAMGKEERRSLIQEFRHYLTSEVPLPTDTQGIVVLSAAPVIDDKSGELVEASPNNIARIIYGIDTIRRIVQTQVGREDITDDDIRAYAPPLILNGETEQLPSMLQVARDVLRFPEDKIILVNSGDRGMSNTRTQFEVMNADPQFADTARLTFVTNGWHGPRVKRTGDRWLDERIIFEVLPVPNDAVPYNTFETVRGELLRIQRYSAKGDITAVPSGRAR